MPTVKESKCPCCGYSSDQATAPKDLNVLPEVGDLSICIMCAAFLQFGEDLELVIMNESVWDDIHQETFDELLNARQVILARNIHEQQQE